MGVVRAAIGIGSNLGDPAANVRAGFDALERAGCVAARSRIYRSKPWGRGGQPDFCNAVALLDTSLDPHALLAMLKELERQLGRVPGERWGPRLIDFDILLYGNERVDDPDLQIPHPRLHERAFALVPLAEVDERFAAVVPACRGETVALMSEDEEQSSAPAGSFLQRVRVLTQAFLETDLVRLRIEDANADAVELRRSVDARVALRDEPAVDGGPPPPSKHLDAIKADLVGILHFARPTPQEGDRLKPDRELAYVEALGIRNPVRSLGGGRLAAIHCRDGEPVEYGQVLFEVDRG